MAARTSSAGTTATRKQTATRTKPPAKKATTRGNKIASKVAGVEDQATGSPAKRDTGKSAPKKDAAKKILAKTKQAPGKLTDEHKEIRAKLTTRLRDLELEYQRAMADLQELQSERTGEGSGEDQADAGTQSFEREQELGLANGILDRMNQVEHAIGRIDNGTYGQCEQCGNPIPKARLEAFPAATLCVTCKQKQERR
ncbi:MAG: TraR/DksA family transcriptional regulator [Corynebacteriales bacterium]|nr:TraR/DksA family transcriptional regulator [Mycobacteriales bacterium]